jgi:DNA ligase-associated metallophosphoesterase
MNVELQGATFSLMPEKTLYWPERKYLFVADLHFGKVMHFRKSGIAVPSGAILNNFDRFTSILLNNEIEKVYLLGDLFHSESNNEWSLFEEVVQAFPDITFELILGNHDIFLDQQYLCSGLNIYDKLILDKFVLTHHPAENIEEGFYNLCGHIHPGVRLRGNARQSLRLPCFYFGANQGILPAFGTFTGTKTLKIGKEDQVFVIANGEILKIN